MNASEMTDQQHRDSVAWSRIAWTLVITTLFTCYAMFEFVKTQHAAEARAKQQLESR